LIKADWHFQKNEEALSLYESLKKRIAMSVVIRKDIPIDEIYQKARIEKQAKIRSRMLGIATILEGRKRSDAAKIAGVTINVMRIWVRRFNEQGFDGLVGKKYPGCPPTWTRDHENFLKDKVSTGAVFERDKRITYRLEDFQAALLEKFGIVFGISTIWYKMKSLKLSWITPRQQHPKSDPVAQDEFKKKQKKT
jgi:transposase